jgi:hypothetical protein
MSGKTLAKQVLLKSAICPTPVTRRKAGGAIPVARCNRGLPKKVRLRKASVSNLLTLLFSELSISSLIGVRYWIAGKHPIWSKVRG